MYSEELDYCRRIKEAGWRVVYLPAAQVTHHSGKSSEQAVAARHIAFQRAKLRYFRKFHGRLPAQFLRFVLLSNYLWQLSWKRQRASRSQTAAALAAGGRLLATYSHRLKTRRFLE
jgi:N-acetylglucosaminyl-diphospho-decaprenol L-rhamnosyltransferase